MSNLSENTISQIQNSIQKITHDIEKEKIILHINQERYEKKLNEYNEIKGKPIFLSKEKKLKLNKEKVEKLKMRQIFSPTYGRKIRPLILEEEIKIIQKSSSQNEMKLTNIKSEINNQALINDRIKDEINEIRKNKLILQLKLIKIKKENEKIQKELERLIKKNKENTARIKYSDLIKSKNLGLILEENFKSDRDYLENKYHKIIETNIRIEKEKKKELSKKRMLNAIFADNARKRANKLIEIKEDQEDIHDRAPILDSLLEKWNYIIKHKKQIINKYIKYSSQIRNIFDKLILFLGLEKYEDLPLIYEKDEIQMEKIEESLSKISSDVDELESQKMLLEKKIYILSQIKIETSNNKEQYTKEKEKNIQNLKNLNDKIIEEITKKRKLFSLIEESTFNFLKKMQGTYLADFVVKRVNVQENSKLTEKNVIDYLGSVYCFLQLINDFNENVQNKNLLKEKIGETISINKNIENLQKEIKFKLSKFNYDNCFKKVKKDIKQKLIFDEIIKNIGNDIANEINNNYEELKNYNEINNNIENSQNINKKLKRNLRYQNEEII